MRLRHFLLLAALLVPFPGCVPVPKKGAFVAPQFEATAVRRVAVAPVIFADDPLDWYFGERIALQLRRETVRRLESMGYEATLVGDTLVRRPPPGKDLAAQAPPPPGSAEGLVVIRIDHFLDAGLYSNDSGFTNTPFFEVYATAALLDPNGRVLWQDEGVGRGSHSSGPGFALLEEFTVPAELAGSLFDTLPPVR